VTQEQTVASPNEPYQSSPETSLQFPARLELPIGRIRPFQEALDATMQALRKMIVPRLSDDRLSHMYKMVMKNAEFSDTHTSGSGVSHHAILPGYPMRTQHSLRLFSSNIIRTRMLRIVASTAITCFSPVLRSPWIWTPEFTVLMAFERNNCVLYFFLLDEPVVIENCRYRFVYGTE
jgi:hypothetical protein